MRNFPILFCFLCKTLLVSAQVGINTENPTQDFEVDGQVLVGQKLFLENIPAADFSNNVKFLVRRENMTWGKYDISTAKFGPINYVEFKFSNLNFAGLQDYNTKISASKYELAVQGYYIQLPNDGSNAVYLSSNRGGNLNNNNNIEGPQFYAYIGSGNTWYLRGFVNESNFRSGSNTSYTNQNVDLFMNVVIYRKNFLTKTFPNQNVDLQGSKTKTIPKLPGF